MFRLVAPLALTALLAGCISPVEQCRLTATAELRRLDREIAATREDIARGYRLIPVASPFGFPRLRDPDPFICLAPSAAFGCYDDDFPRYRREALNRRAEQAKLDSLIEQRAEAETRARRALASCPQA